MSVGIKNIREEIDAFKVEGSRKFLDWLRAYQSSLLVTSHQAGKLLFISHTPPPAQGVTLLAGNLAGCRGIALSKQGLYIYSHHQIHYYHDSRATRNDHPEHDRIYTPQLSYIGNDLAIEDLSVAADEQLFCVSSVHNCLAKLNAAHSLEPIWHLTEPHYHLSGLTLVNDSPKYVTAFNSENGSGIVVDVETNAIICRELSLPNSPRFYQNKLWLLDSGSGYFGYLQEDKFVPLTFCPGIIRGLSFVDNYALVGLSKSSYSAINNVTAFKANLKKADVNARSGVYIIHLHTGQVVHWLQFEGWLEETHDVAFLAGVQNPAAISFETEEVQRTLKVYKLMSFNN